MDRKKIVEDFEYVVRRSHGDGWDYVDGFTTENGFKILQLLKEQEARIEQLNSFVNGFSREAVPVVRYKDCKYCVKEPNEELFCDILAIGYEPLGSKKVNSDWYCANGERKTNCSDYPNS